MIKVLFVCLGNICRSPMAEAVFQKLVNDAGLSDQIRVDSAGTSGWHAGDLAHPGTRKVLEQHHIPYNGRSRQVERHDLDEFDYVLAMDRDNLSYLLRSSSGAPAQISLFLYYAKQAGLVEADEVPDPYYDGGFDAVYDLITRGAQALLNHIRQTEGI